MEKPSITFTFNEMTVSYSSYESNYTEEPAYLDVIYNKRNIISNANLNQSNSPDSDPMR